MKGVQEKESVMGVRNRQKKSAPHDHSLASFGKPRDARQWSSDGFFYQPITPMVDPSFLKRDLV